MRKRFLLIVVLVLAHPAPMLWSHHSFAAQYDAARRLTIRGSVAKVDWVNPHAWIHLDAFDSKHQAIRWMVETSSPSVLMRQGFTKETLVPGTELIVEGYPSKTEEDKLMSVKLKFAAHK